MESEASGMYSKNHISDLVINGGSHPAFSEPVHVGRPNIPDRARLLERINDMLDRRWFSNNGPFVQELETKMAQMLGVRQCILMCNGTVALEIAIRALDMKGEVIVPSFTFVATAHALQWQEITPVFCDVDPRTHCLDAAQVERMITPRTTGIVGVHVWGQACAVEELEALAVRRGLRLMFDASHAFGCSHNGRRIGSFGELEVFSFHATKFFNTFEGGAIVTNNDELATKIRLMKNFGFKGFDNVIYLGTNGKMTEICAAMGLTGLESLDTFLAANERNYAVYEQELAGLPGVNLYRWTPAMQSNKQYVVAEIDEHACGMSRDELVRILHAENVIARRYFYPGVHRMEPYRSYFPHAGLLLPETERVASRVLVLPTGTAMTPEAIQTVCGLIRLALSSVGAEQRALVG